MKSKDVEGRARWLLAAVVLLALPAGCDGERLGDGGPDGGGLDDGGLDGGPDDGGDDAPPPTCSSPPGAACNPIRIDAFPAEHLGDTTSGERLIDAYDCAPETDERGPEIHFQLVLAAGGTVSLAVDEASGVDVDLHLFDGPDPEVCLERDNTSIERSLAAGTYRLVVDTYYDGERERAGAFTLSAHHEPASARSLGTMWNTYYFLADERDHPGTRDTPIYDSSCSQIALVRRDFHDSVCIEGSGILEDGRVINYASTCTSDCPAAAYCGSHDYRICYSVLDPAAYPWGMGAGRRALVPDVSVAVDPTFVELGTIIYLEELDGVVPPGASAPHDGCVRADDTGGAIDGDHFDFFAGTRARWLAWEELLPTRSTFTAWADHPRCVGR